MGMKFLEENLLDHLRRPEFANLQSSLIKRTYLKGAFVSQPGMGENSIFIVISGRVRVYLGYEDKEFNLGILTEGDIYSTHSGTYVQALTEAEIYLIDVNSFRREMVGDAEITKAMVRVLGNILKASFSIIDGLAFKDVNHRLVALLINEANKHGSIDRDGAVHVKIELSIEQIARLVGSTRQTVSTLLSDLSRAELLSRPERGTFIIPDLSALAAVGGLDST